MKLDTRLLRSHRFLSLLPSATLRKLASDAALRELPKGSVVFTQGEPCAAVYLIVSGRCESRHLDPGSHLVTDLFGPGDTLGDREMLTGEPYASTITVVTHSVLLRIPGEDLRKLFDAEPSVAGRLSQFVARRMADLRERQAGVGRIVAMHSLSGRIHERALCRRIGDALGEITSRKVLSVHFTAAPGPVSLKEWTESSLDTFSHFSREVREVGRGSFEIDIQVTGDPREPACVAPLLSHFGTQFDYVLLQANREAAGPVLLQCLVQADLAYLFLCPDTACLYSFKLLLSQLEAQAGAVPGHLAPIVCSDSMETAVRFSHECDKLGHPVHSVLRGFPLFDSTGLVDRSTRFKSQIRALAREIGRCRVGLVFSSGGARGLAHIGVIQVLEENGIEIDAVAGASMGAYVGAVWCHGHDGAECEKIARQLERRWGWVYLLDPVLPPRQGFIRTRRVGRRLRRAIGRSDFLEMARPLRIVATNFETLERVVFSRGEVALAVEASIAVPGICMPVAVNGKLLMDGGVADPLPVDALSEMGVERIIAVNTIPTPDHLRLCVACGMEEAPKPKRLLLPLLNKHLNYFAPGNLLDILMRANHGSQTRVAEQAGHSADVVLRPWSCEARWHDFTNPGKYIALGRKTTEEQLAEIKALTHLYEKPTTALALAG